MGVQRSGWSRREARRRRVCSAVVAILLLGVSILGPVTPTRAAAAALPPEQPAGGPGGSDYLHGSVQASRHGSGSEAYWLFEPDQPRPAVAPLVVFLHGWGQVDPHGYGAWIEHLVRKGAVVVFPRYQEGFASSTASMMEGAAAALQAAVRALSRPGHVRPDLNRVVFAGHSLGALIALNLATQAQVEELPQPQALALLHPADLSISPGLRLPGSLLRSTYEAIPASTRLLVVVGDLDLLAGDRFAQAIWERTGQIPSEHRNAVRLFSDDYGTPRLSANHSAPQAPGGSWPEEEPDAFLGGVWEGSVDALDYYGYWKLLDALMACTFEGRWCSHVMGSDEPLRAMGRWSDGRRVNEAAVIGW